MVKRNRGGADEPIPDDILRAMVDTALAMPTKGGAKGRRPSVVFQSKSTPIATADESATAIVPAAAPVVATAPAPPVVPQEPGVFMKGLSNLMKDIGSDVKGKREYTEQLLVDGMGLAYKGTKVALGTAATALAVRAAPPTITLVMGLGKAILDKLPTQSWNDIYETWKDPFIAAGSTATSAAEFATTPGAVLMIAGVVISTAAHGAGKSVPVYLKDIGTTGVATLVQNIKAGVAAAVKNPAAELNAEVKARLKEKETKEAADAYLEMAKQKEAASALMALTDAPSGGRRKVRKTKKRVVKRRVTRRFVY